MKPVIVTDSTRITQALKETSLVFYVEVTYSKCKENQKMETALLSTSRFHLSTHKFPTTNAVALPANGIWSWKEAW